MKKKILTMVLLGCMVLGLVGCGSKGNDTTETKNNSASLSSEVENDTEKTGNKTDASNENKSENWGYVYINDTKVTFPCSYEDILKASNGYIYDMQVNPNIWTATKLYSNDENKYWGADVYFDNPSDEMKHFSECQVIGVGQDEEMELAEAGIIITFPNGMKIGDEVSKEDLIKLYGEPDRCINPGGFESIVWNTSPELSGGELQVYIKDGKLIKICMSIKAFE